MNFLVAWSLQFLEGGALRSRLFLLLVTHALALVIFSLLVMPPALVAAATTSDIRNTKHNLSKTSSNTVRASTTPGVGQATTDQVCVFCHTPHAATTGNSSIVKAPLWNRSIQAASTYTGYTSLSMDADAGAFKTDNTKGRPAGASLLCLSCHDGTIALGNVQVLEGQTPVIVDMTGTAGDDKMPAGSGASTGFTRLLGTDLSNDHPISVTYNDTLAATDGELRRMTGSQQHPISGQVGSILGIRSAGYKPLLPLAPTGAAGAGQVQCTTCHDPHLYDAADPNRKFLRANRLQVVTPAGGAFSEANDIICLACHDKMGTAWSDSAHAKDTVANYAYTAGAASQRQFATGTQVWRAACLNCHDTHTVSGARRLLREGTDSTLSPKAGGKSAIEETCFQCHNTTVNSVLTLSALTANAGVPDIKTEFGRAIRMPIKDNDQGGGGNATEVHDISNADFIETDVKLGKGATTNRHVECTDCHNPHRVIKNSKFDATGTENPARRTHNAGGTVGSFSVEADGNVASGVLRGAWGVEPTYGSMATTWPNIPTGFTVKSGVPGVGTAKSSTWLTREYQLCFKCHSNYSNTDGSFPDLRGSAYGGTNSGTNGVTKYTNVAAEFGVSAGDLPTTGTDQGEKGEGTASTEDGASINPTPSYPGNATAGGMTATTDINHRSWHPVMYPTGRSRDERRISGSSGGNFRVPFDAKVGTQTMHCSDCHGNPASWSQDSGPVLTQVQGPHGSTANFLLKGAWGTSVQIGGSGLCFNCHNPTAGSKGTLGDGNAGPSGFNYADTDAGGGHGNNHGGKACTSCHIAVPHGWRNKAFLVNLNCVGTEAGGSYSGCQNFSGSRANVEPYYLNAALRIRTWATAGNWDAGNCGSSSSTARSWMESVCKDTP